MNTRTKAIIAGGVAGTLVIGTLGATALAANTPESDPIATERMTPVAPQVFWDTNMAMPESFVAFYLAGEELISVGDTTAFPQPTLDAIGAQLAAAPALSMIFVDTESLDDDGLSMAQTTVVPTTTEVGSFLMATTNEAAQEWLRAQFPETDGVLASQGIENVPNASFTYGQSTDGVEWTTTEYLFQYHDAAVTATLNTTGPDSEVAKRQFEAMFASMTR